MIITMRREEEEDSQEAAADMENTQEGPSEGEGIHGVAEVEDMHGLAKGSSDDGNDGSGSLCSHNILDVVDTAAAAVRNDHWDMDEDHVQRMTRLSQAPVQNGEGTNPQRMTRPSSAQPSCPSHICS
mmetsp:Transcript_31327/g.65968  ORF Transcript_31327/g.65968 Transcript_31327/m.65968 type:complete len:127 (+) Transcript_31327:214-594(+)